MRANWKPVDEGTKVHVSKHATDRYSERAFRYGTAERIGREIENGILSGVDLGLLFSAETSFLIPLPVRGSRPLCAVVKIEGPAERPFGITVCTVLTMSMALETFGDVPGLIPAMMATLPAA